MPTQPKPSKKPPSFLQGFLTILAGLSLIWWSASNSYDHYALAVLGVNVSGVVTIVGTYYSLLAIGRYLRSPRG